MIRPIIAFCFVGITAALALATPAGAAASPAPSRIVSLNPCLDVLLIELVDRERIAAISHYSRDDWRTTIADVARTFPVTYETAEEVVALKPDLVIAGRHSALATRNALKRVGIRFELFDVPTSIAESHAQIRQLAALLQAPERGEAMIARIDAAIEKARPTLRPTSQTTLTAAVYQPGGLTAGTDTITDELMRIVGFDNVSSRRGVFQHLPIPLEELLRDPPDVLLVGETSKGAMMHAERVVHHRALRALEHRIFRVEYPARLLYCAGPTMIHALDALVAARDQASARTAPTRRIFE